MNQSVTPQDLEDAAFLLLLSVEGYLGPNKSALEIAGAAHTVLNIAIQELNKKNEQPPAIGEGQSGTGVAGGPAQIQEAGPVGGLGTGSQGLIEANTSEPPANRPPKRSGKSGKGSN